MNEIEIPETLNNLFNLFKKEGFDFYLVGGAIRSYFMNNIYHNFYKPINDYDITTNATPDQMKLIANKYNINYYDVGQQFGTITFILENNNYEITTYRNEGKYTDSRHPDIVTFSDTIEEDLKRRDFTMNAMYYDFNKKTFPKIEEKGSFNYNGRKSIKDKIIETVGNPNDRFSEDPLRMLRAIRFASQYGIYLDKPVFKAIKDNKLKLSFISKERIMEELKKIVLSQYPEFGLSLLQKTSLFPIIFGIDYNLKQINQHHIFDLFSHTLLVLQKVKKETNVDHLILRLAAIFHDIGKITTCEINEFYLESFINHAEESEKKTKEIMTNLKFDTKTINKVTKLVKFHDFNISLTKKKVKSLMFEINDSNLFDMLIILKKADILSHNGINEERIMELESFESLIELVKFNKDPIFLNDLNINGNDLIQLGIKGKNIGIILNRLLKHIWVIPSDNIKEKLILLVKGVNNEHK